MKTALAFALLFSSAVYSQTLQKCSFNVECPGSFKLEIKSQSGDCLEDDSAAAVSEKWMEITIAKNKIVKRWL